MSYIPCPDFAPPGYEKWYSCITQEHRRPYLHIKQIKNLRLCEFGCNGPAEYEIENARHHRGFICGVCLDRLRKEKREYDI